VSKRIEAFFFMTQTLVFFFWVQVSQDVFFLRIFFAVWMTPEFLDKQALN